MYTEINAVADLLASQVSDFPVHRWAVAELPERQYYVVSGPPWDGDEDGPLSDVATVWTDVRLTAVASTGDAVVIMLARARRAISGSSLTVGGRRVTLTWERAEIVDVDRTVRTVDNSYPFYGVETYQLTSQET